MSKHHMPFPRSGGAYQHEATSNSLQRVDESLPQTVAPPAAAPEAAVAPRAKPPAAKAAKTTKTRK